MTASDKKTEFKTLRAVGLSPKEILLTPRVVKTSGNSAFNSLMASKVSIASLRVSSCPVVIGKVKQSTIMSPTFIPQLWVRSEISLRATRIFQSRVLAWPSSSIVSATTAAP